MSTANVITIATTVLAIAITWLVSRHFYRIELPRLRLMWTKVGRALARSYPERDVSVLYEGKEVPQVFQTYFFVFNAGPRDIHGSNVARNSPIRIILTDGELLSFNLRSKPRQSLGVYLKQEGDASILIGFDHLEKGDGVAVEVLHTGSSHKEVQLRGALHGSGGRLYELQSPLWNDCWGDLADLGPSGLVVGPVRSESPLSGMAELSVMESRPALFAQGFMGTTRFDNVCTRTVRRLETADR
jgi:hypothetical protein